MIRSAWMLMALVVSIISMIGCGGDDPDAAKDAPGKDAPAKDAPSVSKDGVVAPPKPPAFAITGKPGFESPEKAVAFLAECLKSGEFEPFWTLAVTVDDVNSFKSSAALLEKEAALDVLEKSQLGLYLFKMTRANMERHERSWREGFEKVRAALDFTEAVRGGIGGQVKQEGDLKWSGDAIVFFTLEDRSYELKVGKLLLTPRGWLILDDDPFKLKEISVDEAN